MSHRVVPVLAKDLQPHSTAPASASWLAIVDEKLASQDRAISTVEERLSAQHQRLEALEDRAGAWVDCRAQLVELAAQLVTVLIRNAELTTQVTELVKQLAARSASTETPAAIATPAPTQTPRQTPTQAQAQTVEPPKPAASEPPAQLDDLELIEGIGAKIAALFRRFGIVTFRQLADTDFKRMREILVSGGKAYSAANPRTWAEQARYAADGDMDKLKAFKDRMRRGIAQSPACPS
jgi:predicted flap endonuclease-1-like 5' DNA nuclease